MGSSDFWPQKAAGTTAVDEQFEGLRVMFYARLCSERGRLLMLGAALSQDGDPLAVLEDVRNLAHRMGGAAALFEAPEISCAASKLEAAALKASIGPTIQRREVVAEALQSLADVLFANTRASRG